jgi:hypothetical protein
MAVTTVQARFRFRNGLRNRGHGGHLGRGREHQLDSL